MNQPSYENRENDELYQRIKSLLINNPSLGRGTLSGETGASEKACRNRLKWYRREYGENPVHEDLQWLPGSTPGSKFDCKGDTAEAEFTSDEPCKTIEDVIRKGNIDISIWDIERFILNSWEMGYKDGAGEAQAKPLWQVKVWLRRKSIDTEKIIKSVIDRIKIYSPEIPNFHSDRPKTGYMWELDIMDLHVGKFSWKSETGHNWDVKLAVKANNKAVNNLLGMATSSGYEIEQILMPVGNDLLHVNDLFDMTASGTKQDTDGRIHKMFGYTLEMMVAQIDRLKTIAPVHIPIMAGNHDLLTTMHLGACLYAWYHNDENVVIDRQPISRKYYQFGKCLIGYCHGCKNDPNPRDLPLTMANECPKGWVEAIHKHWHIGHTHKSKQISFISEDSFQGISVRTIRSLTATDLWHFNHGYIQPNARAAEAFIWHKTDGMIQHHLAYAIDA